MTTVNKLSLSINTRSAISLTVLGITICFSPERASANLSILVTDEGISMLFKLKVSSSTLSVSTVNESGMLKLSRLVHLKKAHFPIEVTVLGSSI